MRRLTIGAIACQARGTLRHAALARRLDAELRLAEVEIGKARGEYVNPADARETLSSIAVGWPSAREHVMKPSRYRPLKSAWETHVAPRWGSCQIGSLKHSEVQDWVAEMARQRSATTVVRAYGVLAALLDDAVHDRRVNRSVARGVSPPRKVSKSKTYLPRRGAAPRR